MSLYRLFVLFGILTGDEEEEKMKLKKDNLVVSVETEPGSRGAEIAEELAGKLGIPCYGQEILEEASKISGISMKLLKRYKKGMCIRLISWMRKMKATSFCRRPECSLWRR